MWWEKDSKKPQPGGELPPRPVWTPPLAAPVEHPVKEQFTKVVTPMPTNPNNSTVLGRSVALHGELTANEDLLIEGQFDGTIHLEDHSVTVGAGGQVKAEIHARQVVVYGKVNGNISAREKVDIRKTGHVLGDLTTAGVAIEDGAYFKGSIEILREERENLVPARAGAAASGGGDGSSL
jgi:cytoskeletal protein CcmA (bactofilin family)